MRVASSLTSNSLIYSGEGVPCVDPSEEEHGDDSPLSFATEILSSTSYFFFDLTISNI